LRWVDIEPDDVSRFRLNVGIGGRHVLDAVRRQACPLPDARDHHMMDAQSVGQLSGTPMRRTIARRLFGQRQDPRL